MHKNINEYFTTNLNFNIDDAQFKILPSTGEINFKGIAQEETFSQHDNIQQPLKSVANELVEKTVHIRQSWVLNQQNYNFNIPPSYFKKKIVILRNNDQHQVKKEMNQYDFVPYLEFNDEQLNQIRKEGAFDVQSKNNKNIKFQWKVSRWIVKGTKNIRNSLYKDMLRAKDMVRGLGDFIYNDVGFNSLWNFSIVHGLYIIVKKSILIPSVFIGYREVVGDMPKKAAQLQVEIERQLSLRKKNLNFSIYQYLYHTPETQSAIKIKIDYIKHQLLLFEQDCRKIVTLLSEIHVNKSRQNNIEFRNLQEKYSINYDSNKDIDELINEQLHNAQQRFFQKNNLDLPQPAVQQILDLIECYKLQKYYQELLKFELENYTNIITQQYENEFFFLANQNHREKYLKKSLKIKRLTLKKQFHSQMLQELSQQNITDRMIYQEFIENKKAYKIRVNEVMEMAKEKIQKPNIQFKLNRTIIPPYPVVQSGTRYYFIKELSFSITSQHYFWKFTSLCLLYYTLIANSFSVFYFQGLMGNFGLMALILSKPFYSDQKINEQTGEIVDIDLIQTISSDLTKIYKGMEQSREEFESSEDSGMFGKGCLRICNLIEVYIFRFLFVGIICTLILKSMLILLVSLTLFIVFITSFMWAAFVVLIKWLICLLFFDFDTVTRLHFNELDYIHFCMPLFRVLVDILIGMAEVFICLFCLVFFPFLAMLIMVYAIVKFAIRSFYDFFMMIFVYCCGRVPYRSGCMAWRIGGDSIQKKVIYNYHKLTNDELRILAARELEKYILEEYQNRFITAILKPEKEINRNLQPFFNRFNAKYQCEDLNSKLLLEQLSVKIGKQFSLHPQIDPETKKYIKYTESELNEIKYFLRPFVIEQINLKNMHSYIWKCTHLQIEDYSKLVDIIIKSIFGDNILISNEELLKDIQIKIEKEKGIGEQIQRAMKGEVNLNQPEKYIVEKKQEENKQTLQKVYKKFIPFSEMLDKIWLAQQPTQDWSCFTNKDQRFLLNYSLNQE